MIGYLCLNNYGGIVIVDIEYGRNDYVLATYNWNEKKDKITKHKIDYTINGRQYFRKNGARYYIDEFTKYGNNFESSYLLKVSE
jgi:hypothetical protein